MLRQSRAARLHGGDHPLGYPRVLKRDQVVRLRLIGAWLRLDGLQDDGVVQPGFRHADDYVIGQRARPACFQARLRWAGSVIHRLPPGHARQREHTRAGQDGKT